MIMFMDQERNRTRIASAVGVAVSHALIFYALITGFHLEITETVAERLRVFDIVEAPPPPPEPPPVTAEAEAAEEAPAPPNLEAQATPVVAPPPRVVLKAPPIVAAVTPGAGSAASVGASSQAGPGSGAGGAGSGSGGGGAGGSGAGATPARLIRGRISNSDYPRAARLAGIEGTLTARIAIGADGRVTGCTVTRSSGSFVLDDATCSLIRLRFRFAPARDARGREVADVGNWVQRWWIPAR
jgi:protein TonB